MTMRTNRKTVTFDKPFVLSGHGEVLPQGAYAVETDEELLEGLSFPAYRRISTRIHLHRRPGLTQILTIDPNDLEAALKCDQARAESPADQHIDYKTTKGTTESRREEVDRQAMERGEDEGMLVLPRGTTAPSRRTLTSIIPGAIQTGTGLSLLGDRAQAH